MGEKSPLNIHELDIPLNDIFRKINSLDINKSAGPDGIPPIDLKKCKYIFPSILKSLFDKSIASGKFPDEWKSSFITPIHKSGPTDEISNYRPISLLSVIPKLF